jgi:putative membrane protein
MGAAMLFNFLLGLGLLALVVVGVVFGVRWLAKVSGEPPQEGPRDDALEIVRTRYARGEISHEEFDRLRRELA